MSIKKDEALKEILADYESLANLVLGQLDILDNLITNSDLNVPEKQYKEILENESKLDKGEVKLSDKIVNAIALYQPVAIEIRQLIALYRITISLERIGDHAVSIVRFMQEIKSEKAYTILADFITNMMLLAVKMVRNALLSVVTKDMDLAIWTIKNEAVVDELNRKLLKKAISKAQKSDEKKNILISFIQIKEMVSNIERISDHAANIAEASIYAYEGKDIRHHRKQEIAENTNPENNE
jgi:phosphate transport system protein